MLVVGLGVMVVLMLAFDGCRPTPAATATVAHAVTQPSLSCKQCHLPQYQAWAGTDHALANRPVDPAGDAAALAKFPADKGTATKVTADLILGHKPLWQPLVSETGGRWQAHEQAYDPAGHQWFNVFGQEERRPGEWGHWTGRGMNWNSMCAHCHMTGYEKRYDSAADTYHSTWVEQGIGCHGRPTHCIR